MAQNTIVRIKQLIQEGLSLEKAIVLEDYLPSAGIRYSQLKAWISKLERLYQEEEPELDSTRPYFHKNHWPIWIKGGQVRLIRTGADERKIEYRELILILTAAIDPTKLDILKPIEEVKPAVPHRPSKDKTESISAVEESIPQQISVPIEESEIVDEAPPFTAPPEPDITLSPTSKATKEPKTKVVKPIEIDSSFYNNEIEALLDRLQSILAQPNNQNQNELERTFVASQLGKSLQILPKKNLISADPTKVLVCSGKNSGITRDLYSFLHSIGLSPLEVRDAIRLTGKINPSIEEILDSALSYAQVAIVVLTPDDDVRLKKKYLQQTDPEEDKSICSQARGSVLFEAGLLLGRYPDRTILLQFGDVKTFSYFAEGYILHFDGSPIQRSEFANRLRELGCHIHQMGQTWLTTGEFTI